NGRVARLLMNYVLLKNNLPPAIIKSSEKKAYLTALNKADVGDLESFVIYIAERVEWSLKLSLKAGKGDKIEELGDLEKKILQLKRSLNIGDAAKVKVFKNEESVYEIFSNSLLPLVLIIVEKLSQFDILFKAKTEEFRIGEHRLGSSFDNDILRLENLIHDDISSINRVEFYYGLREFRQGNERFTVGAYVFFTFYSNVYEVKFTDQSFTKLYDEILTSEEFDSISEAIGNYVFETISNKVNK
ncbi:MAG: hypothetical protein M3R27_11735, partial [Bacteroidota bacterium]|nr:hypothetical protein [Bacteroidota bacterium]